MITKTRSYSELREIDEFMARFRYLELRGEVGRSTFGFDRWINQQFYTSREWRDVRSYVITRDEGCDLGMAGFEIFSNILIHHMNPITVEDVVHREPWILDPEYLITTTHNTHNAIHYGDQRNLPRPHVPRRAGDTRLW